MEEIYIPIKDFENYSISNLGNIKNNQTNKNLKIQISSGYSTIGLSQNNKTSIIIKQKLQKEQLVEQEV